MKPTLLFFLSLFTAVSVAAGSAKDFTLTDATGAEHSLSQYKGKIVVLEWFSHNCPFVQKHYSQGDMQKLQGTLTQKDVVWLSICSSAPGKPGHMSAKGHLKTIEDKGVKATAVLMDESGKVGKLYGAKTTPHMFVIDAKGDLIYQGAIDNKKSTNPADIASSENFVKNAVQELLEGKPVSIAKTQPYGCGIKY